MEIENNPIRDLNNARNLPRVDIQPIGYVSKNNGIRGPGFREWHEPVYADSVKPDAVTPQEVLSALSQWSELAHSESSGFIKRFCPSAWVLTSVSWDSHNMRFVYILENGQHISDSVEISQWLDFLADTQSVSRD